MKISFVVVIPDGLAEFKKALLQKLSFLASLGYQGVELAVRDPEKIKLKILEEVLVKTKLGVPAIGTGLAFLKEGLSLSSSDKKIRKEAEKRIKKHIDLAKELNSRVVIGLIRGKINANINDSLWKICYLNLIKSMEEISGYAAKMKVTLLLEPLNRYETSFLQNIDEALFLIDKIKYNNLKILLDTYHMNIEEKDFISPIIKAKKYISHVHLVDNNRSFPGAGHIDFRGVINSLREINYRGYLSGEITIGPDYDSSLREYIGSVKKLLGDEQSEQIL